MPEKSTPAPLDEMPTGAPRSFPTEPQNFTPLSPLIWAQPYPPVSIVPYSIFKDPEGLRRAIRERAYGISPTWEQSEPATTNSPVVSPTATPAPMLAEKLELASTPQPIREPEPTPRSLERLFRIPTRDARDIREPVEVSDDLTYVVITLPTWPPGIIAVQSTYDLELFQEMLTNESWLLDAAATASACAGYARFSDGIQGLCIHPANSDGRWIIIIDREEAESLYPVLGHEIVHAVDHIFRERGIALARNNEEQRAELHFEIFHHFQQAWDEDDVW